MQKRFSPEARSLVAAASNAAAFLRSELIEPEHLLVAILAGPPSKARAYLERRGMTLADVEAGITDTQGGDVSFDDDDVAALSALGFDLPQILQQLEERFGPTPSARQSKRGPRRLHPGFSDGAKEVLRQALVEASWHGQQIAPEHLLLAMLRAPDASGSGLIAAFSLNYDEARVAMFAPPESNAS